MKFFNVKTAIAAVCVVAAGFGGVKAYNAAAQSETDMLLAENVEALTATEGGIFDWTEFIRLCNSAAIKQCPWKCKYPDNVCNFSFSYCGTTYSGECIGYTDNSSLVEEED